jgi:hypothetical protein
MPGKAGKKRVLNLPVLTRGQVADWRDVAAVSVWWGDGQMRLH